MLKALSYPPSSQQEQIYNTMVYTGKQAAANVTVLYLYKGRCSNSLLVEAIRILLQANEALNLSLSTKGGSPRLISCDCSREDTEVLAFNSKNELDTFARTISGEELLSERLYSIFGINLDNEEYGILLNANHMIVDAWSAKIIGEQFSKIYSALATGSKIELTTGKYTDFIDSEQHYFASAAAQKDKQYWTSRFEKNSNPVFLVESETEDFGADRAEFTVSEEFSSKIAQYCNKKQVSLMTLYACAYSIYMTKHKQVSSYFLGQVCHNRSRAYKNTVGMFVNTIPALIDVEKTGSFIECVESTNIALLSGMRHQRYNYSKILSDIRENYNYSGKLYDTTISYQNLGIHEPVSVDVTWYNNGFQTESLMIHISEDLKSGFIKIVYDYQYKKLDRTAIDRLHNRIMHIVRLGIENDSVPINEIGILPPEERELVTHAFNSKNTKFPANETLISLFEEQVRKTPNRISVVDSFGRSLTYGTLDFASNQLARRLQKAGVIPNDTVALLLRRGVNQIIGILAVLKAGAAYVPVDVEYPTERKTSIFEDAQPKAIITDDDRTYPQNHAVPCININDTSTNKEDGSSLQVSIQPESLAYIIFTSGTTGRPKGVMISHRNVVRLLKNDDFWFDFVETDVWMQFHSYCFDFSVWEIFGSLLHGAKLIVPSEKEVKDSFLIRDIIAREKLTVLNQVPSSFYNLSSVDDGHKMQSVRYLIFGGEALAPEKLAGWKLAYPAATIVNMYGITETTVHVTCKEITEKDIACGVNTIGSPIPTLQVYVLNGDTLCGIQMPGEICVTGEGVAQGYCNNSELTKSKFVNNPFGSGKMYRSGDLAEWLPNGSLRYIGRIDQQIQLHGFRVELSEIEGALRRIASVTDSAVICRKCVDGNMQLYAYFCASQELNIDAVRESLEAILPQYMVPSYLLQMEALPITPNGKLDREALPEIKPTAAYGYIPPVTEREKAFVDAVQRVLFIDKVGMNDNYISMGGDSIKAIKIVSIMREHDFDVKVWDITHLKTIGLICDSITNIQSSQQIEYTHLESAHISPIQKYFINKEYQNPDYYLQSLLFKSDHDIPCSLLEATVQRLIIKHPMLHASFENNRQFLGDERSYTIHEYSLHKEKGEAISRLIKKNSAEVKDSIALNKGKLIGIGLFHTKSAAYVLLAIHHMVIDGVSWRILLSDFSRFINEEEAGHSKGTSHNSNPVGTTTYFNWSESLYQRRDSFLSELPYWQNICAHSGRKALHTGRFIVKPVFLVKELILDENISSGLTKGCHKTFNTQINDIIAVAVARTMIPMYGGNKVVAEFESHGRTVAGNYSDIFDTVGWFTSIFPVLLELSGDIETDIASIKDTMRAVPNNGTGFMVLKEHCGYDFGNTIPPVRVNYLGDFEDNLESLHLIFDAAYLSADSDTSNGHENDVTVDCFCFLGKLHVRLTINTMKFTGIQIDSMPSVFSKNIEEIVNYCLSADAVGCTPYDFGDPTISLNQFKPIVKKYTDNMESIGKMTPMQEGMVYHHLNDSNKGAYIIQTALDFQTVFNAEAARKAFNALVARHDILRTAFWHGGELMRRVVVHESSPVFDEIDFSDDPGRFVSWLEEDKEKGFAIEAPSLIRLAVVKLDASKYTLVWTFHHLILDGWSFGLCLAQFFSLYSLFTEGKHTEANTLITNIPTFAFQDYVTALCDAVTPEHDKFWNTLLAGYEGSAVMRPANRVYQSDKTSDREMYLVEKGLHNELMAFCRRNEITLNTVFETAVGILLQRYYGVPDVVFGKVVSGRNINSTGIDKAVGMLINTIPCRVFTHDGETCVSLLHRTQASAIESNKYELSSLTGLYKATDLQPDSIQTLLVFENYNTDKSISELMKKCKANIVFTREQTNYDLTISVFPGDELSVQFMFDPGHYQVVDVNYIFKHLTTVLSSIVSAANNKVSNIPIMDNQERETVTTLFNGTDTVYPHDETIISLFRNEAKKQPRKTAVIYQDKKLSYSELDELSDNVARAICRAGFSSKNGIIPFIQKRDENIFVSMLGILKSGNGYLPIDPALPLDRIQHMISDSGCKCVVLSKECDSISSAIRVPSLCVEDSLTHNGTALSTEVLPEHNCYIIYTSGSTGVPKGVVLTHRNTVNFCCNNTEIIGSIRKAENPIMLSTTTIAFDIFVTESLLQLINGLTILLASREQQNEQHPLAEYALFHGASALQTTPSKMRALLYDDSCCEYLANMSTIILGGEELPEELYCSLAKHTDADIFNIYGPSEATVWITTNLVKDNDMTIGRPFANTQIFILQGDRLCAVGEPGELCVCGDSVGLGYLHRPELNKEKFVTNPFGSGLMYRTGDLACWRTDGCIHYIGRIDNQIKINGQRIELGEIENTVRSMPDIQNVVVVVNAEKSICCYFVADKKIPFERIENRLRSKLPVYMIPQHFMQIEKMPLTGNGKLDRRALPECEEVALSFVGPKDELEQIVAAAFCKVLNVEQVSVNESFFSLGGDSIKSIQLVSLLYDYDIHIKDIEKHPTVRSLAKNITASTHVISQDALTGETLLMPAQSILAQLSNKECIAHFNQSILLETALPLEKDLVQQTLKTLIKHHDALRLSYEYGSSVARFVDADSISPYVFELRCNTITFNDNCNILQNALSLADGKLIGAAILKTPRKQYLLLVLHHWCCDGISQRIITEDFISIYQALKKNETPQLQRKTDSVRSWANAIQESFCDETKKGQIEEYWMGMFSSEADEEVLSYSPEPIKRLKHLQFAMPNKVSQQLSSKANGVLELLLAAFCCAYKTEQKDITVFLESHGRDAESLGLNVGRTVGWFTSAYPIKIDVSKGDPDTEMIEEIRDGLKAIPESGISYSVLNKSMRLAPLFNYMGLFEESNSDFKRIIRNTGVEVSDEISSSHPMIVNIFNVQGQFGIDLRYSPAWYSKRFINRLKQTFKKNVRDLLRAESGESLAHQIVGEIKDYSLRKDEAVSVMNPEATNHLFLFPPAMLRIAYLPLFEKLSALLPSYRFHVFHMTANDGMASLFGDYIIKTCGRQGNLVFLGYSGGGNIAYDTASYLQSIAVSVAKIIMLDGFRWEEGVKFVTLTEDSIDEMIQNFIKQTNIDSKTINTPAILKMIANERSGLIDEAHIYQEYCELHRNCTTKISNCEFINILSEDSILDGSDTRKGWAKVSQKEVRYLHGVGDHLTMLSNPKNLKTNARIILDELGGTENE